MLKVVFRMPSKAKIYLARAESGARRQRSARGGGAREKGRFITRQGQAAGPVLLCLKAPPLPTPDPELSQFLERKSLS